MRPTIRITITGATSELSKHITESISEYNTYKYTYLKQLVSRLRVIEQNLENLPDEARLLAIGNTLITERNIAAFAAEQYAMLNQDELFEAFMEVVEEIESLFK